MKVLVPALTLLGLATPAFPSTAKFLMAGPSCSPGSSFGYSYGYCDLIGENSPIAISNTNWVSTLQIGLNDQGDSIANLGITEVFQISTTPIPEPGTWFLAMLAIAVLCCRGGHANAPDRTS